MVTTSPFPIAISLHVSYLFSFTVCHAGWVYL